VAKAAAPASKPATARAGSADKTAAGSLHTDALGAFAIERHGVGIELEGGEEIVDAVIGARLADLGQ
jgi:hypothetical protein